MADHDGHTVNVGPVTVGIDTDALRSAVCLRSDGVAHATLALCDEVDRLQADNAALERMLNAALVDVVNMANEETAAATDEEALDELRVDNATLRDLLAKALPWVDPNENHDAYLLTVAIRDALGEGS